MPGRVPHGFYCGYPLPSWGSSVYGECRGVLSRSIQGDAIREACRKFGVSGRRAGDDVIPFPVCHQPYHPFGVDENGIKVKRYGCAAHNAKRASFIRKFGVNKKWESFAQFHSVKKRPPADEYSKRYLACRNGTCAIVQTPSRKRRRFPSSARMKMKISYWLAPALR